MVWWQFSGLCTSVFRGLDCVFCDFAASACCELAGFRFSDVKMVVWWVC